MSGKGLSGIDFSLFGPEQRKGYYLSENRGMSSRVPGIAAEAFQLQKVIDPVPFFHTPCFFILSITQLCGLSALFRS